MILALLAAVTLMQNPPVVMDELRLLASKVALGQVCEAIEQTTVNYEAIVAYAEALSIRGEAEGRTTQAMTEAQEQGYSDMMGALERNYQDGREGPNYSKLLDECATLVREEPRFFPPAASQ